MSDLLDFCAASASWTSDKCAEVRVGDHVTRYVRRGSGAPVVLVGADAERNPIWAPLVEALSANHRIVVPECPRLYDDKVEWLRGFIEGIGLTSIALVAGGDACIGAHELAATDHFTVRRLVMLPENRATPVATDGQRTLIVPGNWSPVDAVRRIGEFIRLDAAA